MVIKETLVINVYVCVCVCVCVCVKWWQQYA